ncbi:MAG: alpha/beta hydrolase, partial [Parvularculaceae bacterium]|nr:alpha/beta hydrolase [Parvularculaceae bacterium]
MTAALNFAFVHGGGQGGWVWDETIAALEMQSKGAARAVALDVPGCGAKRGQRNDALTIWETAAALNADLAERGYGDCVLVGHSQAGTLLPIMSELAPGAFAKLVYVACAAPKPGQTILELIGSSPQGAYDDEVGAPFDPALVVDMRERNRLRFCNDMDDRTAEA